MIQSLIILLVFQSIIFKLEAVISNYKKELDHPRKGLINIQNIDDNECFKWRIVRYLNPTNHHLGRITKPEKDFAKTLDFTDLNFPAKIRDIPKIEKNNSIDIIVFG